MCNDINSLSHEPRYFSRSNWLSCQTGARFSAGHEFVSSPSHPDRLWALLGFLSYGVMGALAQGVKRPEPFYSMPL